MKNSSILCLIGASMAAPLAQAEIYELLPGETISELLHNRLGITPIYQGYLQKVLKFNNLTMEDTKKLPQGTKIALPSDEHKLPVPTPSVKSPAPPASTASYSYFIESGPTIEIMSGNRPAVFSSSFFYPHLNLGVIRNTDSWSHQLQATLAYITVDQDQYLLGENQLFNKGLEYQVTKKEKKLNPGLIAAFENTTLIAVTADRKNYRLRNPYLFSFGPNLNWHTRRTHTDLTALYSPGTAVDSDHQLNYAFKISGQSYYRLKNGHEVGLQGQYGYYQIEEARIKKLIFSGSYRINF
jgi:hypothetical protein